MYRGFLICPKALVSDKCTLIKYNGLVNLDQEQAQNKVCFLRI